uniref:Uncharacterized protein n=1 Tax=Arundo donax TaxID=35708 RepID=A0A0A9C7X1_ARUDO
MFNFLDVASTLLDPTKKILLDPIYCYILS